MILTKFICHFLPQLFLQPLWPLITLVSLATKALKALWLQDTPPLTHWYPAKDKAIKRITLLLAT